MLHDVFVVFWQIVDIPFIFNSLSQLENHFTLKKGIEHYDTFVSKVGHGRQDKNKEQWLHLSKPFCHVEDDSLSSCWPLNWHMCTKHMHTYKIMNFNWCFLNYRMHIQSNRRNNNHETKKEHLDGCLATTMRNLFDLIFAISCGPTIYRLCWKL